MKAVRFIAGLIALVLIVVGAAVAVLLGPDDTWGGDPAALPDAAPVITTAPELLNVAGLELTVTASSGDGEVFVGAGHPVHVQDYLGQVTRTEISELGRDGVGGSQLLDGERAYPAAPPTELDVWDAQAVGEDAEIRVPLTADAPVQVTVLPTTAKGSAPQIGIGYDLPGAFVAGLVTALIGLLLLVSTIMWGRRARRAKQAEPAESATGSVSPQVPVERQTSTLSRSATRVAVIGTVAVLAAGCSIPQQVDHGDSPGVVPLEKADAPAMLDDYDKRNNAAIKKSHTGDGSLWKTADAGPFLVEDMLSAKTNRVEKPKGKPGTFSHEALDVFEVEQPGYPLWSLVDVDLPNSDLKGGQMLYLYSKDRAASPWKGYSSLYLPQRLVTPLAADAATPDEDDLRTAAQWDDELDRWLAVGKDSDLRISEDLQESHNELSDEPKGILRVSHSVSPWGGRADGRTQQDGPVRVQRVKEGLLVLTHKEWERNMYLEQDWEWKPDSKARKIFGPQASETVNDQHYALTAAILVPETGDPSVIGSKVERVIDFPR